MEDRGETVYLVSCVKEKRATRSPAKDLYTSPWFRVKEKAREYVRKAREYVERRDGPGSSCPHGTVCSRRTR